MSSLRSITFPLLATLCGHAAASTCVLTGYSAGSTAINLGSTVATSAQDGFYLEVDGGEPTFLTASSGNNFPCNYPCASGTYATFPDSPVGNIGICIENEDSYGCIPGRTFGCRDWGGAYTEGYTRASHGFGTASQQSFCGITFDCTLV